LHEYEIKILQALKGKKELGFDDIVVMSGLPKDSAMWAIENLAQAKVVGVKRKGASEVALTQEGEKYVDGFPEERLLKEVFKSGKLDIRGIKDQIALAWAKKNAWIMIDGGMAVITQVGKEAAKEREYPARILLQKLASAGPEAGAVVQKNQQLIGVLAKRGLLTVRERSVIDSVAPLQDPARLLSSEKEAGIGTLTRDMIKSGAWRKERFRPYSINAPVEPLYPARLHPVREFINYVRQQWLEMGFVEIAGPIIEAAFWNFDALFSPQDHPTREMQDTFFLSNPRQISITDMEAVEEVRTMHELGWKEKWNENLAKEALLRTHVTALSARYMRKLANAVNENYPQKFFSVGSVFRNENLDYKHLAELHQYEGIIIGNNLTFANLIDSLKKFYAKLGFEDVKLRPSYFPFTEPSLEAYYYDEEHGDTIELAGAGIIRPEITKALGINRTVLAWGGGLERFMLSARMMGLDSIVTPYKNNVGWLRSRPNIKV
jgi:phenylalanyl-tRNA synthetase alpha chain